MALCDVVLVIALLPAFSAFCSDFSRDPRQSSSACAFKSALNLFSFRTLFSSRVDSAYEPKSAFAEPKLGTARDIHSGIARSNRPDHALASLHALMKYY
ncbi:pentatricopeptide repeat-containing protein [Dorcoceras hygrometricum]|uniref:Pentatricopeptide repeat-containing protein n=1 Tax=Dorcoceras hygrometricum TaxID=472368 RepID=A0A2Z7D194_9LAMI|nr:pentatricopeptide repeat-containing protein [Dorcoceras hygrometricum]